MPAMPLRASGILNGLLADDAGAVVDEQIDGQHVAHRRLANETLLRGNAHARFRRGVVEPQGPSVEQNALTRVARRLQVLDDVSELVRLRILFGKDRQRLMRLFLAGDIFGEGDRRSKRLPRVAYVVGGGNDVRCGLGMSRAGQDQQ